MGVNTNSHWLNTASVIAPWKIRVSIQTIIAAVSDLIFGSRIRAAAQLAGVSAVFVRTPPTLLEARAAAARAAGPRHALAGRTGHDPR
jgi:hypothetical protein